MFLSVGPVNCHEEQLMGHLGVVLHEYLGEEYLEVLGSIVGALKSIVNIIGITKMTPPIKDLLPRLTPILKNRHEKFVLSFLRCLKLTRRVQERQNRVCTNMAIAIVAETCSPFIVLPALMNDMGDVLAANPLDTVLMAVHPLQTLRLLY
ncbi:hypothetical protein RJT34_20427 [Clitoria ternatea]|uniref:Uncharacterized protein n=1 Tax=Clitoria ternatea TaxID=43366 RepID=A0AAN9P4Y9_CLITE